MSVIRTRIGSRESCVRRQAVARIIIPATQQFPPATQWVNRATQFVIPAIKSMSRTPIRGRNPEGWGEGIVALGLVLSLGRRCGDSRRRSKQRVQCKCETPPQLTDVAISQFAQVQEGLPTNLNSYSRSHTERIVGVDPRIESALKGKSGLFHVKQPRSGRPRGSMKDRFSSLKGD